MPNRTRLSLKAMAPVRAARGVVATVSADLLSPLATDSGCADWARPEGSSGGNFGPGVIGSGSSHVVAKQTLPEGVFAELVAP
jgi:hypothetical protein